MYVKQDYDFKELEQFIKKENLQLYYAIRNTNQQDNFVLLSYDYIGESPSPEELNRFMTDYNYMIQEALKLI